MSSVLEKESVIEQYLVIKIKQLNGKCLKWSSPNNRGVPDRIVFVNNQIWFIELKRPGGKLSKLQEYNIKWLKEYTDNVIVLDSKIKVDYFVNNMI